MKKIWEGWKKFGFRMGNIISTVMLTVFYFTVFALFAIPFRMLSKYGKQPARPNTVIRAWPEGDSNFSAPRPQRNGISYFEKEF